MKNEERKFITYERIKREKKFNMLIDWQKVLEYAERYLHVNMGKKDYFFIIENYSDLRARYLR